MTVIHCQEIDLEGQRTWEISLADGETSKRTYRVRTNDPADKEPAVFAQAQTVGPTPLPSPLTLFPGSTNSLSHHYSVERDKPSTIDWLVTVNYKSFFNQLEIDRSSHEDPTERPIRISGGARTVMVPVRSCLRTASYGPWPGGSPTFTMVTAANSAGDPLDPPIEVASTEWEFHCIKNVPLLPTWVTTHNNGVNNADQNVLIQGQTWTFPKGQAKLSNLLFSDTKQENGVSFLELSWDVTVRNLRQKRTTETAVPSPWDVERLDEGMRKRVSAGTYFAWTPITDKGIAGAAVSRPVPFNGSGDEVQNTGVIAETDLKYFCYRPFGLQVDYSKMPWT